MKIFNKIKEMFSRKQGFLQNIQGIVIAVLGIVVTLIMGFLLLGKLVTNPIISADANATAAVVEGKKILFDLIGWTSILVILAIIAIVLVAVFAFGGQRAQ